MVTSLDRWEKDPFFAAAEEVQESADRMDSAYRTWIHAKKDLSSIWNSEDLQRDLRIALRTAKWQLDEFERAVRSSYRRSSSEDSVARHHEFVVAIEEQISKIEKSLHESARSEGNSTSMRWVHLDQHESDELALFLVGTCVTEDGKTTSITHNVEVKECLQDVTGKAVVDFSKPTRAHAGIETWKIAINNNAQQTSSDSSAPQRPQRVPSFSGLLNYMENTTDLQEVSETELRASPDLTRVRMVSLMSYTMSIHSGSTLQ